MFKCNVVINSNIIVRFVIIVFNDWVIEKISLNRDDVVGSLFLINNFIFSFCMNLEIIFNGCFINRLISNCRNNRVGRFVFYFECFLICLI